MQSLRLAIITRRFWPYCGPTETDAAEVAEAISKKGQHVEILTIRWEKNWPRSFQFREIDVTRIGRLIGGPWGMFRYLRRLSHHVRDTRIDGLIVYGLADESWAAIRNFAASMPVIVRIDGQPLSTSNRRTLNPRQLAILKKVKRILVDTPLIADELISQYADLAELISVVPPSVRIDPDFQRSTNQRVLSRDGLSDAHPILQIEPNQPLVICASPQFSDPGMLDLIDAWRHVLDRFPRARLWILGDGLKAREIWERICELNLAESIVMPGFFDEFDEVLQAADVYVHPLYADVGCRALIRALVTGICCVAAANSQSKELIQKNHNGLLVPQGNPLAMAEAICLALDDSDLRIRLGRVACQLARTQFDVDRWADSYLTPFLATHPLPADSTASP